MIKNINCINFDRFGYCNKRIKKMFYGLVTFKPECIKFRNTDDKCNCFIEYKGSKYNK